MLDSADSAVLAIDGGGTRCRIALASDTGTTVIEAGPANAFTDFDGSVQCLLNGLADLSDRAGADFETLCDCPAFVGLAGVMGPETEARLAAALPLTQARYADDRVAALRGALGPRDGVIAHCGTGSFFAAQWKGAARLAGGWGAVLGDEASAQWVGRLALAAALRQVDGFDAPSACLDGLLDQFGGPNGILDFASTAVPETFGSLAPTITHHAADGDPAARMILQSGANHIADGLLQMGWTPGIPICLTGGIGPHYGGLLPPDMQDALADPLGTPLDGAIALAWDLAKEATRGHR